MGNENASWDIDTRLRLLVAAVLSPQNDWKQLEARTGIPAEKWRQWHRGTTKPSAAMIEALCGAWPRFAFWIATGLTDPYFGHSAPSTSALGFPFATGHNSTLAASSEAYFKAAIDALEEVVRSSSYLNSGPPPEAVMTLAEDGVGLALNARQLHAPLGPDERKALIESLWASLRHRLEDVLHELRNSESWVDAAIDYQRESEKNLEAELASLAAAPFATVRTTSTPKNAPPGKPKRKPSR